MFLFLKTVKTKPEPPQKNPFKDRIKENAIDEDKDLKEILRRYDSILRAFVLRGYFKLIEVFYILPY